MADAIIPVRALPLLPHLADTAGLQELVQTTLRLLPDATHSAFAAAQNVDFGMKASDTQKLIAGAAAAAATAAAVPLPFADALAIVPIQVGMIVGISIRFGIDGTTETLLPLASSLIGCLAATAAGRLIVGALLKLVPGGGVVNATVAFALTTGLGRAYLAFLLAFHQRLGRLPTADEIVKVFGDFWKKWDRKGTDSTAVG